MVDELEAAAAEFGTAALQAAALGARGALETARGHHAVADRPLRRAIQLWQKAECPYDVAKTRALLGNVYRAQGDDDAATMELRAAKAAFEHLGARLDAQRLQDALGPEAAVETTPAAGVEITRTFMLTDIVGSTSLIEAIGDAAWTDLTRWHDETLRVLFARYRGEEIDHAGDGFFVAFESPAQAVDCAIAIQRALADHRRRHGFAPRLRIGVHHTHARRRGITYRGRGVHVAARIAALAGDGEIVASAETAVQVPPQVVRSPVRSVTLRGLSDMVDIVTIEWR
jgi:class 3 adenylate cyclase